MILRTSLQWLIIRLSINHSLNLQNTSHTRPSYGMYFVRIWEKIDSGIMASHWISILMGLGASLDGIPHCASQINAWHDLNTGISDFHNLVAFNTKMHVPKLGRRRNKYRTFKTFDETSFKHDIEMAPYHVGEIFDDFDDTYWFNHTLVKYVMDNHAPLKHKQMVKHPVPFMNSKLRKACHQKAMLRNIYFKNGRTKCSWENYRKIRNHVAKLKSTSIQNYFAERCSQNNMQNNPSRYWETVKPFMTDKMKTRHNVITLQHNGKILNDPSAVSNIFNDYFSNVALEIGNEKPMCEDEDIESVFKMYENHQSVKCICENMSCDVPFYFSKVTVQNVESLLRESDSSKAAGYDNIPPKLLKVAAKELAQPIATLVNKSVTMFHFPSELKKAELSPLFKPNDNLNTQNYPPISILTSLSKIFENIYNEPWALCIFSGDIVNLFIRFSQALWMSSCVNQTNWRLQTCHWLS